MVEAHVICLSEVLHMDLRSQGSCIWSWVMCLWPGYHTITTCANKAKMLQEEVGRLIETDSGYACMKDGSQGLSQHSALYTQAFISLCRTSLTQPMEPFNSCVSPPTTLLALLLLLCHPQLCVCLLLSFNCGPRARG